jgi:hypothetical protein
MSNCIYNKMNNKKKIIEELGNDWETRQFLKERFMKLKIQEAKDKKGIVMFDWSALPEEVEEKIMAFKYEADLLYIPKIMKEKKMFNKMIKQWFFKQVKEAGKMSIPMIKNDNVVLFLANIINKKTLWYQKSLQYNGWKTDERTYNVFTKDKTPSFENCAEYCFKNYKDSKVEKTKEVEEDKYGHKKGVEIGAIVFLGTRSSGCCVHYVSSNKNFTDDRYYKLMGETKTMWKVQKVNTIITELPLQAGDYHTNRKYTYTDDTSTSPIFNISKQKISKYDIKTEYTTENCWN